MTTSLPVASPDDLPQTSKQMMKRFNVRRVVVFDDFKFN